MAVPGKSTLPPLHLLFFGDHVADVEIVSWIRDLAKRSKHSPALGRYLQEATDSLRLELSRLPPEEYGRACGKGRAGGSFDSLVEVAETNDRQAHNGILTSIIFFVGRVAELVAQAEQDPSILGSGTRSHSHSHSHSHSRPVEIVGLCMGLLPGTVALAATDTAHIYPLAREMLGVTFRLARGVWQRMRLVEATRAEHQSWARTYLRVRAQEAQALLDRFHHELGIPTVRRVAVGVTSSNLVTLLGPPSSLKRLHEWPGGELLRAAPQINNDAGGWVHTPYIPELDVDAILGGCSPEFLQRPLGSKDAVRMVRPDGGACYEQTSLGGLLAQVLDDIVHNVLRLDETFQNSACWIQRQLREGQCGPVNLVAMGPNSHVPAMTRALEGAGINPAGIILAQETVPGLARRDAGGGSASHADSDSESGLVAVVGMAGRFPDNNTIGGFWTDLLDGKTHIREVPRNRFDVWDWHDPTSGAKNSTVATKGAWLSDPGGFDHRLFNVSPREAAQMDPIHRGLLSCSYEALQDAGYSPQDESGANVSTFFGQLGEDWHDIIHQRGADIYYVPGIARAFAPSRVNYHYKFGGGSYAVDSACASSITAVVLACQALESRACDMALAGGGNMMYTPVPFSGLSRSGMISPTDGCRTFHDDADGYARGEGIGVVVLKRLQDAVAHGDNILGVISGSARKYSTTTTSMTHPSHTSQERIYRHVLAKAGVAPCEIAYVEMHGTGTQEGDLEEMTSVANVLAPPGSRARNNPLTVGTVKAAVGHGEAAAGVTALIKALLMLRHGLVPPQPAWPFQLNRRFPPLEPLNMRIATQAFKLAPSPESLDGRTKLLVNSFDASGGESCLVVQEAPSPPPRRMDEDPQHARRDPRTAHIVAVSGKSCASLRMNRQRLLDWLELHPDADLADVAYTTTARRMHEPLREAYLARTATALLRDLGRACQGESHDMSKPRPPRRIFLFTGQGSHYAGMGSVLFATNDLFRQKLLVCQQLASHMSLPCFVDMIADPGHDASTASTTQIQLAIVALEICIAETLSTYGVTPTAVLGHSLGEYAALCVAGVLSIADTLYLVGQRAQLMERHLVPHTHAMLATSCTPSQIEAAIDEMGLSSQCSVACKNGPAVAVASGPIEDVERLQGRVKASGARATMLMVAYGFHSAQVDPILHDFTELASKVAFNAPLVPVVSSYRACVVPAGDGSMFGPSYLAQQCRGTVDFVGAVQQVDAMDQDQSPREDTLWIEAGPDPILIGLLKRIMPHLSSASCLPVLKQSQSPSADDNWHTLSAVLRALYTSGTDIQWPEFHRQFRHRLRLVDLPRYAFDQSDFWHKPFQDIPDSGLSLRARGERQDTPLCPNCATSAQGLPTPSPSPLPCSFAGFPTTSVPRVDNESIDAGAGAMTAVFTADTSEPNLLEAIQGHVVHGHAICPMSLLADMALTAAKHCHFKLQLGNSGRSGVKTELAATSITDIDIARALVLRPDEPRKPMIRIRATSEDRGATVVVAFSWIRFKHDTGPSEPEEQGGTCIVRQGEGGGNLKGTTPGPGANETTLFLVRNRIQALRALGRAGDASVDCLSRRVLYRIFCASVDYSPAFQGIDEAIIDTRRRDATARVSLPEGATSGSFLLNPFWIDALTHLPGFTLNSGLLAGGSDGRETLFMAKGFDSWHVTGDAGDMKPGKTYTTYTFLKEAKAVVGQQLVCDCYVLDEHENLLQMLSGLRFQKLRTSVLHRLLFQPATSPAAAFQEARQSPKERIQLGDNHVPIHVPEQRPDSIIDLDIRKHNNNERLWGMVLSIIAEEVGCRRKDLGDEAAFTDLGIDSIMAISIVSSIRSVANVDLESSFFIRYPTVDMARQAFDAISMSAYAGSTGSTTTTVATSHTYNKHGSDSSTTSMTQGIRAGVLLDRSCPQPGGELQTGLHLDCDATAAAPIWVDYSAVPARHQCSASDLDPAVSSNTAPSRHQPDPGKCNVVNTRGAAGNEPLGRACKVLHLSGPRTANKDKPASPARINLYVLADETGSSISWIRLPVVQDPDSVSSLSVWGVESPSAGSARLGLGAGGISSSVQQTAALSLEAIWRHQGGLSSPVVLGGIGAGALTAIETARLMLLQQRSRDDSTTTIALILVDPLLTHSDAEASISGQSPRRAQKERARQLTRDLKEAPEPLACAGGLLHPLSSSSGHGEMVKAVSIVSASLPASKRNIIEKALPGVEFRTVQIDGMFSAKEGTLMRSRVIESTGRVYETAVKEIMDWTKATGLY